MKNPGFLKQFSIALIATTVLLTACGQRSEEGDTPSTSTPQFNENGEIINGPGAPALGAAVSGELTVRVSSDRNFIPTGGSDVATITAYVTNEKNQAVADQAVEITSDGGVLQSISSSTDENGEASATLALARDFVNRDISVKVEAGEFSASVVVQAAGTAVSVSGEATVDVGQQAALTATLTDGNAAAIANRELRFTSKAGNLVTPESAFTDTQGQVTALVSTDRGDDEITISAFDGTVVGKHRFTIVRQEAQSIPLNVRVTSDRNFIATGGNDVAEITAFVTNLRNQAVAGREVLIQSDGGVLQSITAVTDENGEASATLSLARDYRNRTIGVSVSVGDYRGKVDVQAAGTRVDVSGDSSFLKGEVTPFTATLVAGDDSPIGNQTVRFTSRSGSTFSPATAVTNSNGDVRTTVTKAQSGDDVISVSAFDGTIRGSQAINVVENAEDLTPYIVRVVSDPGLIPTGGNEQTTITAFVTDKQNQAVAGQTVQLSSDGGVLQGSTGATDANGEVTARLSLAKDFRNRTITVTAQVGTVSNSVSVQSVGTAIAVDGPASIVRGEDATMTATLAAANGEAIANQDVQFSAGNGTSITAASSTTDANGRLELSLANVTQNDEITVSAYGGSVTGSLSFQVVDDAEALTPYSIRLASSRSIIPTGGDDSATITAYVTDDRNQAASGQRVEISSDVGVLTGLTGTTDGNGEASATLSLANDYRNRPITLTAVIGTVSTTLSLQAAGTGITLSGPASVVSGNDVQLEALLYSGDGNPIGNQGLSFSSQAGNSISPASLTTDGEGKATVTVSSDSGDDEIRVTAIDGTVLAIHTLDVVDEPAEIAPLQVRALTDRSFLKTGTSETATITVLITNDRNQVVVDQLLNVTADGGVLSQISQATDENGEATARLALEPGFENKRILVTAEADGVESVVELEATGSRLDVNGPASLVTGDTARLSAVLTDGGGNPIGNATLAFSSAAGNVVSPGSSRTDEDGRIEFDVTTNDGSDTISVSALDGTVSGTHEFSVANDLLTFIDSPDDGKIVVGNAGSIITVQWESSGQPVVGQTLQFSTTSGTVTPLNPATSDSAITNADGQVSVQLNSPSAGQATLSVESGFQGGPATQLAIEFTADAASRIALQNTNSRVQTGKRSKLIAFVRDANGNPVKGERVQFTSDDLQGGRLEPASVQTQADGRAATEFVAGSNPTTADEIVVTATVASNDSVSADTSFTVLERQLNVTLGTSNRLEATSASTQYSIPFVVQVADGSGVPLDESEVVISLQPVSYSKGVLNLLDKARLPQTSGEEFEPFIWAKIASNVTVCSAEDGNGNRVIDDNEDFNGNGFLDPQDPALIVPNRGASGGTGIASNTVVTDERGSAYFELVYPKSNANWATVEIIARARDLDAEAEAFFVSGLPMSSEDALDVQNSPPNVRSPYGTATDCSVAAEDE